MEKNRSLGEGCPNEKFSEERCVRVRARGLCDGEAADAHWANLGLQSVLLLLLLFLPGSWTGFCLRFVSVLSRPTSPKLPITQRVALSYMYTLEWTRALNAREVSWRRMK